MTTTIDIDTIMIHNGSHESPDKGHCILEVVSMLAGEPWGDHPECVCPVVGAFARRLNDAYGSDDEGRTEAFRPLVRKLMGTRGSRALELRRMFAAADAAVRIFAPLALDAAKQPALAEQLRSVPVIADKASALNARDIARKVYAYAAAAYAAYAAAAAAAAYAYAYAAAYAAAAAAAAYAAYAAAAADAAYAYAYAAADAAAAAAAAAAARRLAKKQARRKALAHGIALLHKLCEMQDDVAVAS